MDWMNGCVCALRDETSSVNVGNASNVRLKHLFQNVSQKIRQLIGYSYNTFDER